MQEPEYEVTPLAGDTDCMVKQDGGRCGKSGEFHLLLSIQKEGGLLASLCSGCFEEVKELATAKPLTHPIGPNCGMPGTYWSETGCFIP